MRIGIISDIHGNYLALEAILDAFEAKNVDNIICLGDMIGYFHQSLEVLETLINLDIPVILGNHEAYLLGHIDCSSEQWNTCNLDYVKNSISTKELKWLSSLPKYLNLNIEGKKIACFHGSPYDPLNEYIYPDYNNFDKFINLKYDYIFLGHTHYQMRKMVGKKLVINPGSCGLPRDGDYRACAVVLDIVHNPKQYFIRENYDISRFLESAQLNGVNSKILDRLCKN